METGFEPRLNHLSSDWRAKTRGIDKSGSRATPIRSQRCSDFAARTAALNLLIIGAERSDEFADAKRLVHQGHKVVAVNPYASLAARNFAKGGGTFVHTTIECLPLVFGSFDLICENYPYTVARVEGVCEENPCQLWLGARAMRAYAVARLRYLAPGGRWIVFTESPGFADALRSIVHRDQAIRRNFSCRIVRLIADEAPQSSYPRLPSRFKVILQRHPAESYRTGSVAARKACS